MASQSINRTKKILVIDPDREFCNNVRLYLEEDYQVLTRQGLRNLEETVLLRQIDLLIIDADYSIDYLVLLIGRLRSKYPSLKIILMYTYFNADKQVERILASDVDDVIAKPFDVDRLKAHIDVLLSRKKRISQ